MCDKFLTRLSLQSGVLMAEAFGNKFEEVQRILKQNKNIQVKELHCDTHDPNTTVFLVAPQTGALTTANELTAFLESLTPGIPWTSKLASYERPGVLVFGNIMFTEVSHLENCSARRWTKIQAYPDTTILEKAFKGTYRDQIDLKILHLLTWWKRKTPAVS